MKMLKVFWWLMSALCFAWMANGFGRLAGECWSDGKNLTAILLALSAAGFAAGCLASLLFAGMTAQGKRIFPAVRLE